VNPAIEKWMVKRSLTQESAPLSPFPVTADIRVIWVEAPCADNEAQNSQHRQG